MNLKKIQNPQQSKFIYSLYSEKHIKNCETSCHDCLKAYRNINYHGLLDWRLAVSLLKTFISANYKCGLDEDFSGRELEGWLDTAKKLRNEFCKNFSNCSSKDFAKLPGLTIGNNKTAIIIHPFWDTKNPIGLLAKAINSNPKGKQLYYIDTFNLWRRSGYVYKDILK